MENWPLFDSLYMTVITLTTVGYGEIREIGAAGRVFTIVLIFLGVGFYLYVVGNLIQFLVEGHIREILGRRKAHLHLDSGFTITLRKGERRGFCLRHESTPFPPGPFLGLGKTLDLPASS